MTDTDKSEASSRLFSMARQLALETRLIDPDLSSDDDCMVADYGYCSAAVVAFAQAIAMRCLAIVQEHDRGGFSAQVIKEQFSLQGGA